MVVVQLKGLCINGFVKGPSVCCMFFREHLFKNDIAVLQLLCKSAPFASLRTYVTILKVFFRGFDGAAGALPP